MNTRWMLSLTLCGLLAACGPDAAQETGGAPTDPAPTDATTEPADPAPAAVDADVLASYDRGLDFLLGKQQDGRWSSQGKPDASFTAMAVTALLERPGGAREADRKVIDQAVAFVAESMGDDGGLQEAAYPNYMTSVAVMALKASGEEAHDAKVERAVDFIRKFQFLDESGHTYGGVGYGSDKTQSDLSNTQYALASLRAAGIGPDDPVFQRAVKFLDRTQNRKENETPGEPTYWTSNEAGERVYRSNDGGANYRPGDSKAGTEATPDGKQVLRSYGSMTYALLRCYHLAGVDVQDGRVQDAVTWVSQNWVLDRNPGMPEDQAQQGLFYYYATIGKTLPLMGLDQLEGPSGSIDWRKELAAELLKRQRDDGSWKNDASRWWEADPVLATAYALTALAPCAN